MYVQTGITAHSNAKLKSSSYSQQDLVALASESNNIKKTQKWINTLLEIESQT